jgi:hypothetical protein
MGQGRGTRTGAVVTATDWKVDWEGELLSVQPRIRLTRSFDQRSRTYLGYALRVRGTLAGEARDGSTSRHRAVRPPCRAPGASLAATDARCASSPPLSSRDRGRFKSG